MQQYKSLQNLQHGGGERPESKSFPVCNEEPRLPVSHSFVDSTTEHQTMMCDESSCDGMIETVEQLVSRSQSTNDVARECLDSKLKTSASSNNFNCNAKNISSDVEQSCFDSNNVSVGNVKGLANDYSHQQTNTTHAVSEWSQNIETTISMPHLHFETVNGLNKNKESADANNMDRHTINENETAENNMNRVVFVGNNNIRENSDDSNNLVNEKDDVTRVSEIINTIAQENFHQFENKIPSTTNSDSNSDKYKNYNNYYESSDGGDQTDIKSEVESPCNKTSTSNNDVYDESENEYRRKIQIKKLTRQMLRNPLYNYNENILETPPPSSSSSSSPSDMLQKKPLAREENFEWTNPQLLRSWINDATGTETSPASTPTSIKLHSTINNVLISKETYPQLPAFTSQTATTEFPSPKSATRAPTLAMKLSTLPKTTNDDDKTGADTTTTVDNIKASYINIKTTYDEITKTCDDIEIKNDATISLCNIKMTNDNATDTKHDPKVKTNDMNQAKKYISYFYSLSEGLDDDMHDDLMSSTFSMQELLSNYFVNQNEVRSCNNNTFQNSVTSGSTKTHVNINRNETVDSGDNITSTLSRKNKNENNNTTENFICSEAECDERQEGPIYVTRDNFRNCYEETKCDVKCTNDIVEVSETKMPFDKNNFSIILKPEIQQDENDAFPFGLPDILESTKEATDTDYQLMQSPSKNQIDDSKKNDFNYVVKKDGDAICESNDRNISNIVEEDQSNKTPLELSNSATSSQVESGSLISSKIVTTSHLSSSTLPQAQSSNATTASVVHNRFFPQTIHAETSLSASSPLLTTPCPDLTFIRRKLFNKNVSPNSVRHQSSKNMSTSIFNRYLFIKNGVDSLQTTDDDNIIREENKNCHKNVSRSSSECPQKEYTKTEMFPSNSSTDDAANQFLTASCDNLFGDNSKRNDRYSRNVRNSLFNSYQTRSLTDNSRDYSRGHDAYSLSNEGFDPEWSIKEKTDFNQNCSENRFNSLDNRVYSRLNKDSMFKRNRPPLYFFANDANRKVWNHLTSKNSNESDSSDASFKINSLPRIPSQSDRTWRFMLERTASYDIDTNKTKPPKKASSVCTLQPIPRTAMAKFNDDGTPRSILKKKYKILN
ncbi:hypothetical protein HELRODRAFT_188322 [Helobdella robusta]|uniref:Uncharacterized protein n=1 Tax=Helobdella robusta TaxID=6412 RepID=T1FPV6_HELRO|nr:hypothetical protein HELRODRAFT_188322 [Helobdella robusta]ESO06306.1 hypothetical protein HELRODRAFT_188322 [Helobdella robusta]